MHWHISKTVTIHTLNQQFTHTYITFLKIKNKCIINFNFSLSILRGRDNDYDEFNDELGSIKDKRYL